MRGRRPRPLDEGSSAGRGRLCSRTAAPPQQLFASFAHKDVRSDWCPGESHTGRRRARAIRRGTGRDHPENGVFRWPPSSSAVALPRRKPDAAAILAGMSRPDSTVGWRHAHGGVANRDPGSRGGGRRGACDRAHAIGGQDTARFPEAHAPRASRGPARPARHRLPAQLHRLPGRHRRSTGAVPGVLARCRLHRAALLRAAGHTVSRRSRRGPALTGCDRRSARLRPRPPSAVSMARRANWSIA